MYCFTLALCAFTLCFVRNHTSHRLHGGAATIEFQHAVHGIFVSNHLETTTTMDLTVSFQHRGCPEQTLYSIPWTTPNHYQVVCVHLHFEDCHGRTRSHFLWLNRTGYSSPSRCEQGAVWVEVFGRGLYLQNMAHFSSTRSRR